MHLDTAMMLGLLSAGVALSVISLFMLRRQFLSVRLLAYNLLSMRATIIATGIACFVLFYPGQVRELYRLVLGDPENRLMAIIAFYIILSVLSFTIYCASIFNPYSISGGNDLGYDVKRSRLYAANIFAVLLGAAPLVAVIAAVQVSSPTPEPTPVAHDMGSDVIEALRRLRTNLEFFQLVTLGLLTGVSAVSFIAIPVVAGDLHFFVVRKFFFLEYPLLWCLVIISLVLALPALVPLVFWQSVGTLFVLTLFLTVVVGMAWYVQVLSDNWALPFAIPVLLLPVMLSLSGVNDNNEVRKGEAPSLASAVVPLTVADGFRTWYRARPDLARYAALNRKYPVYVIAVAGGGLYAAYHSALFLARMQDICPRFSQHIFAISAVSGGALGAATFVEVARRNHAAGESDECRYPVSEWRNAQNAKDVIGRDFLAPLVSVALFPDLAQRFIPFAVPPFDRARALERSFEQAWQAATTASEPRDVPRSNPFQGAFRASWLPAGLTPALFFNATEVASGRRRVLSPLAFEQSRALNFPLWSGPYMNMRTSTAIGISARFPWITPPAWFHENVGQPETHIVELVDGGYFDNSGAVTALDIISEVESQLRGDDLPPFRINLIVIAKASVNERSSRYLADTLSPIRALLSTRQARGQIAVEIAQRTLDHEFYSGVTPHESGGRGLPRVRIAELVDGPYAIPLGWQLNSLTEGLIYAQAGSMEKCEGNRLVPGQDIRLWMNSDCAQLLVYHELQGTEGTLLEERPP